MDLFQNIDGSTSSRRIFGALLIAYGFVGATAHLLSDYIAALGIGLGAILIGVTTFDWMKK